MKDIINKINDLKIQRDDLIKQDSISNEIMKCYDQMIELQKH